jgi:hypothetical protein
MSGGGKGQKRRERTEKLVEESHLLRPVLVRSLLAVGEHESLARVEATPNALEPARLRSDAKEGRNAEKESGGSASLEDELVRPDEHGRLAVSR